MGMEKDIKILAIAFPGVSPLLFRVLPVPLAPLASGFPVVFAILSFQLFPVSVIELKLSLGIILVFSSVLELFHLPFLFRSQFKIK